MRQWETGRERRKKTRYAFVSVEIVSSASAWQQQQRQYNDKSRKKGVLACVFIYSSVIVVDAAN